MKKEDEEEELEEGWSYDIVIDESVPKSKYPKAATVSRNVPINYTKTCL